MAGKPLRHWATYTYRNPPPEPPGLLPLSEMVARIEAARLDAAPPICVACGSTTPTVVETKWCPTCQRSLPITLFWRNRARPDGRQHDCHECARVARRRKLMRRIHRLTMTTTPSAAREAS